MTTTRITAAEAQALLDGSTASRGKGTIRRDHRTLYAVIAGEGADAGNVNEYAIGTAHIATGDAKLFAAAPDLAATVVALEAERDEARAALAGSVDPLFATSLRENVRAKLIPTMGEEINTLAADRDELRAALLNERGEGEPPSAGWRWVNGLCGRQWSHTNGSAVSPRKREDGWGWDTSLGAHYQEGVEPTAREAMRAADRAAKEHNDER
jgi:hypothetical protein